MTELTITSLSYIDNIYKMSVKRNNLNNNQYLQNASNQDYVIKILDKDFTIEEYLSTFSPKSPFPQIVLHESGQDTHLGGCVQTVKFLKQNNIVT